MKRIIGIATIAALALAVGVAAAQGPRHAETPRFGAQQRMPATMPQQDRMMQFGHGFAGTVEFSLHDEAAAVLGITSEELQALHAEGASLEQIAADLGVDGGELHTALVAARDAAIDQAVADGFIDELRAAPMQSRSADVVQVLMTREGCAECPRLAGEAPAMAQHGASFRGRAAMTSSEWQPRHQHPRWGR
jgi:predicted trehalose synthase